MSTLTWSSKGSSQKAGMYLAHSTSTSSCSFMDSHTSAMLAIFFARMSPLIPETGDVICRETKENAENGWAFPALSVPARSPSPDSFPVCRRGDGWWVPSQLWRKLRRNQTEGRMMKQAEMREDISPRPSPDACPYLLLHLLLRILRNPSALEEKQGKIIILI